MLNDPAEAEDVAQETFVRLMRADLRDEPRTAVSWIYRTSTRIAIDRIRARSMSVARSEEGAALELLASVDPPADHLLAMRRALAALAGRLPARELEMALLHRLDGLTQAEIAEVLRVSERTVRRWLTRLERSVTEMRQRVLS